jgi:LPS-assembly protein
VRKRAIFFSVTLALAFLAGPFRFPLAAAPVPWEITADRLIHLQDPDSVLAEGNVVLTRAPHSMILRADWVRYDVERGLVRARGNVHVIADRDEVTAESADLAIEEGTGTFRHSTIFMAETHMFVRGDEIIKTGEFTYTVINGWASACKTEEGGRAPWSFASSTTKLTVDGMAHLRNVRFQIKEVPLLYSPYMVFPVKTKRESGFLFPEWSHSSRDGFGITAPFFINLSPSMDVTLYPGYLTERGLQYGAQYRYAQGPDSYGTLMFSFLRDDLLDGEDLSQEYKGDGLIRQTADRYWLRGKADHDFGGNLRGRLDLDLVSDQDYLQEFRGGLMGYTASNDLFLKDFGRSLQEETISERESSLQLSKGWENMALSGELRTRQEAAHDIRLTAGGGLEEVSRPVSPLQALPRIDFSGRLPIAGTRFSTSWNTEYVNYWRDRGIGAHRLDLHPSLITFLPRYGWVEGKVTAGIRETLYQVEPHGGAAWDGGRFQDRLAYDFTGNMATTLMREFAVSAGGADWLEHMVRPNLVYEYVTRTQEKDVPHLDPVDRLDLKNWLTWELNNYFTLGGDGKEGSWNRAFALFKVLQTYDIREGRREAGEGGGARREWSDLRFDLQVFPLESLSIRYETNVSMYGKGVSRYELLSSYNLPQGHGFSVDYRYLKNQGMLEPYFYTDAGDSVHDLEGQLRARLSETLLATASLNRSFSHDHTVTSSVGLVYRPHCWMMEMEMSRSTGDQRVMVIFSLDGIGRALRFGREI